jgi:TatD DNase family protein
LLRAVYLSEKYDQIYFAVGIHPYDINSYDINYLEQFINHRKCVAIRECGLDYFRLPRDKLEKQNIINQQKKVFISQINLAKKYKKPLIIHIRDASNDSKQIILETNASDVGGVLHCFNADEQLLSLANKNFYFGIGGVLTFKNSKKLVEILLKIPKEKLLIETDGPYLTPHPYRGTRNEPKYTNEVASKMAELLNINRYKIEDLTTLNANRLFNFDKTNP